MTKTEEEMQGAALPLLTSKLYLPNTIPSERLMDRLGLRYAIDRQWFGQLACSRKSKERTTKGKIGSRPNKCMLIVPDAL